MLLDRIEGKPDGTVTWGSDVAAQMLRRLGVRYVSLNPGASYRGLHDSLVNHLGNEHPGILLCLHEDHAVAIAHGYAKVTGEPMGCVLHSNVGLLHGMMGLFNAWCDRVPMVVLGTAHAAKFPDAVEAACGVRPQLPDWVGNLNEREERVTTLPADQGAVERHILSLSRAAREGAAA